jgi:hypothetical protein
MVRGRGARSAAQYKLVAHELAVVFADRASFGLEARISHILALGPFPNVAVHLRGRIVLPRGRLGVKLLPVE